MAFLGFAERAALVREGETNILKWNVLGLKNIVLVNFFPFTLNGWNPALAMRHPPAAKSLKVSFRNESGEEIGSFKIQPVPEKGTAPLTATTPLFVWYLPEAWIIVFVPLPNQPQIIVQKPGRYFVVLKADEGNEETIGEFYCHLVEPAPFTPEREAAIKSNPRAARAVRAEYGCNLCSSKYRVYAAFERMPSLEAEGFTWYKDIAEYFNCECGKTQLDLSSVKRNFFAVLGQPLPPSGEVSYVPLYERSVLESLLVEFVNLVNTDPLEETLQKFIERNPILLHQFAGEELLSKPPILARFKADFALVTPQKELVLIEIERPTRRLLKKDGEQHSDLTGLTHAIEQINQWLGVADEHRLAVLEEMRISPAKVSTIRGVVISGRDAGNDANHLRRLRGSYQDRVTLLTYDDLTASLALLAQRISNL